MVWSPDCDGPDGTGAPGVTSGAPLKPGEAPPPLLPLLPELPQATAPTATKSARHDALTNLFTTTSDGMSAQSVHRGCSLVEKASAKKNKSVQNRPAAQIRAAHTAAN